MLVTKDTIKKVEQSLPRDLHAKEFHNIEVKTSHDSEEKITVSMYFLANALKGSIGHFINLLDDYINSFKGWHDGFAVGLSFRSSHRTLQGSMVEWVLGFLAGIAQQEYTDARNESAINTAQKITAMVNGENFNQYYSYDTIREKVQRLETMVKDAQNTKDYTLAQRRQILSRVEDQLGLLDQFVSNVKEENSLKHQRFI